MQLLLSITALEPENKDQLDNFFIIYDTEKNIITKLKFDNIINRSPKINRGMGICYYKNFFYAALFVREHRVAGRLLIVDLNTGIAVINKLTFSKAMHSITPYGDCGIYNMILANSTQNDTISIITTYDTQVITEDIYFDFLSDETRLNLNWHEEYKYDDLLHINDVYQHGEDLYVSMFYDYKKMDVEIKKDTKQAIINWRSDKIDNGAIYNLTKQKLVQDNLCQSHSIIINQFDEIVFCNSGTFSIINSKTGKIAECKGFTRGLCEDKERGGYWVGLSYHRVFCNTLKGATLQFISYDMKVENSIDLSKYGKEIYDIIPFKTGRYHL